MTEAGSSSDGLLPPEHRKRDRTCGKYRYEDKKSAKTAANYSGRSRGHRGVRLEVYHCAACNGWHLTGID